MDGTAKPPFELADIDIAVIGMAARVPGARDSSQFWRNLAGGVESIERLSEEDLRAAGIDRRQLEDPRYVRAAPVLPGLEEFDAAFFDISPAEASIMDPQRRLFMEQCWAALENAGYVPEKVPGAISVFAGAGINTYILNNLYDNKDLMALVGDLQMLASNDKDGLPMQVSYHLNLTGPSVNVNTACSSGLVAVHLARQSLLLGECDLALAGASALVIPNRVGYVALDGGVLSPDGHCRPYDANARGTLWGSGVGVVVLRRLEDAKAAGDNILCVIKGSAINNDGSLKVGYLAPSVEGQAELLTQAYASAGVSPDSVSFVEGHGTGTALGDPIEFAALAQAFQEETTRRGYCALGSAKSNIGHLGAAAGIASLIKAVLALQHRQLPPTVHFEKPNPMIPLDASPFYVNRELRDWESADAPRRAGVSSFGVGGTNAHVVLEEYVATRAERDSRRPFVIPISARNEPALARMIAALGAELRARPELALAEVANTLQHGRREFACRAGVVCRTVAELADALEGRTPGLQRAAAGSSPRTQDATEHAELERWLSGAEGRWRVLAASEAGRVALPSYRFDSTRHWIEPLRRAASGADGLRSARARPTSAAGEDSARDVDGFRYRQTWVEAPLARDALRVRHPDAHVLLIEDELGIGARVAELLTDAGARIVRVEPAQSYARVGERSYCADLGDLEHATALVEALKRDGEIPNAVLLLSPLSAAQPAPERKLAELHAAALGPTLFGVVHLVRALAKAAITAPLDIAVYANGLHDITGREALCPEKAGLLAACKVVRQEYPNLFVRSVDLELEPSRAGISALARCIARDALASSRDIHSAYRGRKRWCLEYRRAEPEPETAADLRTRLRNGGVYLVYGGFTGLAPLIDQHLIDRYAAKLILVGEGDMPPETAWDAWLADHPPGNYCSLQIASIRRLQQKSARYAGRLGGFEDLAALKPAIASIERELGAIEGVLHAAGSSASGKLLPIGLTTREFVQRALAAGPISLRLIDGLFAERELGFRVHMASLSSVFGGPGFLSYASANAIASSFLHARNRELEVPWKACWWDSAQAEFRGQLEESMQALVAALRERVGRESLTDEEVIECFERFMSDDAATPFILCKSDFAARYDAWVRMQGAADEVEEANWHDRPELAVAYVPARNPTEAAIARIFERLLGVRRVGVHDDFFALGGHSLLAVQLVARLREEFAIDLGMEMLLVQPTVAGLSELVAAASAAAPAANEARAAE